MYLGLILRFIRYIINICRPDLGKLTLWRWRSRISWKNTEDGPCEHFCEDERLFTSYRMTICPRPLKISQHKILPFAMKPVCLCLWWSSPELMASASRSISATLGSWRTYLVERGRPGSRQPPARSAAGTVAPPFHVMLPLCSVWGIPVGGTHAFWLYNGEFRFFSSTLRPVTGVLFFTWFKVRKSLKNTLIFPFT